MTDTEVANLTARLDLEDDNFRAKLNDAKDGLSKFKDLSVQGPI